MSITRRERALVRRRFEWVRFVNVYLVRVGNFRVHTRHGHDGDAAHDGDYQYPTEEQFHVLSLFW
jgi:hypothetical protein